MVEETRVPQTHEENMQTPRRNKVRADNVFKAYWVYSDPISWVLVDFLTSKWNLQIIFYFS